MKHALLAVLFSLGLSTVMAQEVYTSSGKTLAQRKREAARKKQETGFDPSRLVFGGGMGLSIGNVTDISVAPIIGYRFNDDFAAGVGFGYEYLRTKSEVYDAAGHIVLKPVTAHILTPSVWGRYIFWRNLFAQLEYEHKFAYLKSYTNDFTVYPPTIVPEKINVNQPALLVGAGIKQPISERSSFVLSVLVNVLEDKYGFYNPNRLNFRFGIVAGF